VGGNSNSGSHQGIGLFYNLRKAKEERKEREKSYFWSVEGRGDSGQLFAAVREEVMSSRKQKGSLASAPQSGKKKKKKGGGWRKEQKKSGNVVAD